jgi:hypothetical protein
MSKRSLVTFLHDEIDSARERRGDIRDHNCYAAGYEDATIAAHRRAIDFYLGLGDFDEGDGNGNS